MAPVEGRRRRERTIRATLLLLAGLGAACKRAPQAPPSVVLVVVDTLRADHVSSYGYRYPTTPAIDTLAARSDRYEVCEATAPWTVPSHASLFTGMFAFQHGANTMRLPDGRIVDALPLAAEHVTLAEVLQQGGYRTGGFVANSVYLAPSFGFDQGFATYEARRAPAAGVVERALEWLDGAPPQQPVFLFLNLMDAHRPYNIEPLPPERSATLAPLPQLDEGSPRDALLDRLCQEVLAQGLPASEELAAQVRAQYDHGIAHADSAIGALLEGLQTRGRFEDAVVIVTSDHGEYFGEHGLVEHSKDIYEEALRVPLVIKRPRQERGEVRSERVSLADVPGLVARELEAHVPDVRRFTAPGVERPRVAENRYSRAKDLAAPYGRRFQRERIALFAERYKLILSSDGQHELFDLGADPREQRNLAAERPQLRELLARRLKALLETSGNPPSAAAEVTLSPEDMAELRRLGYL